MKRDVASVNADADCPFMRVNEVAALVGLSVREVWRRSGSGVGGFPRKRKLSARVTVWVAAEVDLWVGGVVAAKKAA